MEALPEIYKEPTPQKKKLVKMATIVSYDCRLLVFKMCNIQIKMFKLLYTIIWKY